MLWTVQAKRFQSPSIEAAEIFVEYVVEDDDSAITSTGSAAESVASYEIVPRAAENTPPPTE